MTPKHHNPLFHPKTLRNYFQSQSFPADLDTRRKQILPWIELLKSGKLGGEKEMSLHGQFLERVFGDILGYRGISQGAAQGYELCAEKSLPNGKSVDGALGFFGQGDADRIHCVIELKRSKQSLDVAAGRILTPVQQAWEYASFARGCRWILVSNFGETRLYHSAHTPGNCEVFRLEELGDPEVFKRFYGLLARDYLLPPSPLETARPSVVEDLLSRSAKQEAEITEQLYRDYRHLRTCVYEDLCRGHSNLPKTEVLAYAQTLLDRILFIAFAEDRGLLPENTLEEAIVYRDKYRPAPAWQNFQAIFRWIDEGHPEFQYPAYNGGLFAPDPNIDMLELQNETCKQFKVLSAYDFREDVSVDVLGHIFEQSITDLEEIRAESEGKPIDPQKSKRKVEGVFYTPSFITQFIVEQTLGRVLDEKWQAIVMQHKPDEQKGKALQEKAWLSAWESYREALRQVRVLDLSCGSGAFLTAAFDRLARSYDIVNAALSELRKGQVELFDLDKTVLNNNLFGVDLNGESVEITKLSLWLKTAQRGRKLTYLDRNIKRANSIVGDAMIDPRAFDWKTGNLARSFIYPVQTPEDETIDARWREGFDVVIGNPPYVRQELIGQYKEHFAHAYRAYNGVADLYVYFMERGISLLKPGGRLGYIVANKWMKAEYGDKIRSIMAKETRVERLVDFGHAPIFPDADTFPCVIVLNKPGEEPVPEDHALEVTRFPREALGSEKIQDYVMSHFYAVPQSRLGAGAWSLEPPAVEALMERMRQKGTPLAEYAKTKPYYGIKTGFNEAFLIDTATRNQLVKDDPASAGVIKKYLRGQDIRRWSPEWNELWMIVLKSSHDHPWPWASMEESKAEICFQQTYPSLYARMKPFEPALRKRSDRGRCWWELRPCAYYDAFERSKLIWKDLSFHSEFCSDNQGHFTNDLCFFLPAGDTWLLAVLNSPLLWAYLWRNVVHGKDEVLRLKNVYMERLPIAEPTPELRDQAETMVPQMIALTRQNQEAHANMLDALRLQFDIDKPGQKLEDFSALNADDFIKEILARRPKSKGGIKPAAQKELRQIHAEESQAIEERKRTLLLLERRLSKLVNSAYGLSPEDVELLWATAPPRMPVGQ